ncbi:MAG: imidazole glycerol phosphate synthase subunit HisH, partial [Candidatus Nitrosotenuis sp.]
DYDIAVPAVVNKGNLFGTQFHPEKSGKVGSLMLKNFLRECKK